MRSLAVRAFVTCSVLFFGVGAYTVSAQQSSRAPEAKYVPPYFLECGRAAPGTAQSAQTRVLYSPDGTKSAYGETQARAIAENVCSNTSQVFVQQNGGEFKLIFSQQPTELLLGNGVRLIDWSRDGAMLLFDVLRWQYGSDAAPYDELWLYVAQTGTLTQVPLMKLIQRFGAGCLVSVEPLGFSDAGEVAMRFSITRGFDVDGTAATEKCEEKRAGWSYDSRSGAFTERPYDYSVPRWGKMK